MDTAALEAIKRLKYAYFRTLDLKQFEALGALLTEDATSSYEDGKTVLEGREAIVRWLSRVLGDPGIVTEHHGHHPEIDFTTRHRGRGHLVPPGPGHRAGGRRRDQRHRLLRRPLPPHRRRLAASATPATSASSRSTAPTATLEVRSFTSRFPAA